MKVLIFYSKTGGGHLRAAQALAEEISSRPGYQVVLSDGLEKTNWGLKTNPAVLFFILSHYGLAFYNLFYKITDNQSGLTVLRTIIKFFWGANFKKIINSEKPDLIITTHHFISPSTIARLDKIVPFDIVVVDLGKPHRIWFDDQADQIIVPNQEMTNWAKAKFLLSENQIKPLGYPLKKAFKQIKKNGFSNQILIMGAGIRTSQVKKWIKDIKNHLPDKKISVVCGHNIVLKKRLSKIEGINLYGFIDNLHEFLQKADMIITKAGPGIIVEAASLGKPLIITNWVGHQEKGNVDFVLSNDLGVYDAKGRNLVSTINHIYQNYQKYTKNLAVISVDTKKIVDQLLESQTIVS